jgi:hypothetical protein
LAAHATAALLLWLLACSSGVEPVEDPPEDPSPQRDDQPPTASIASPAGGAALTGSVTVQVNAQDNVGVTRVELLVDGVVGSTDEAAPWEFTWNTDNLAAGGRNLSARAYDAAGNAGSSAAVAVTIQHPDGQAPTASITSPAGGTFLTGVVSVQVNAQDNVGVTRVELWVDGVLAATDAAAPWGFTWDTDGLADGPRSLSARAHDAAGNVGSSPGVSVTIRHPYALTFRNQVHTDIALSVQGQPGVQVVPAGQARTLLYQVSPGSVDYSGSTSGRTTQGTQVGLLMVWDYTLFTAGRRDTVDLFIDPAYFFVYVQNAGTLSLNSFYVNYGLVAQTFDNITIANDGQSKAIGYYRAYTNTQVRGYRGSTGSYIYWNQGIHFTLPWTDNQAAYLFNNIAGAAAGEGPADGFRAVSASGPSVPSAERTRPGGSASIPGVHRHAGHAKE